MDLEQLKQDFLEEISSPIDLFFQENRQRMADTKTAKTYDKIGLLKHVLDEVKRVIQHYKETDLPKDYLSKVIGIIKPIVSIGKETELLEIEKILSGVMHGLNQERGMKPLGLETDEDDVLAVRLDMQETFMGFPTSDYELLKKAVAGEIEPKQRFMTKNKVVTAIKKDYNKNTDPEIHDFIIDRLEKIFNVLWDDEFEQRVIEDLKAERARKEKSLIGVKESIRAAMLTKLMP